MSSQLCKDATNEHDDASDVFTVAVSHTKISIFYCAHSTVSFQCVSFFFAATSQRPSRPSQRPSTRWWKASNLFFSLFSCILFSIALCCQGEILLHEKKKNEHEAETGSTAIVLLYSLLHCVARIIHKKKKEAEILSTKNDSFKRCLPVGLAYTSRALAVAG